MLHARLNLDFLFSSLGANIKKVPGHSLVYE